jgi:hypothetical protein
VTFYFDNIGDRLYTGHDDSPLRDLDQYEGFLPHPRLPDTGRAEHTPKRPEWDCACCGKPWPCDPAQEDLVAETGGGTALAIACWAYLEEHVRDLGDGPLPEVFERFIGWTRSIYRRGAV